MDVHGDVGAVTKDKRERMDSAGVYCPETDSAYCCLLLSR
eukprot:gene3661-14232_t